MNQTYICLTAATAALEDQKSATSASTRSDKKHAVKFGTSATTGLPTDPKGWEKGPVVNYDTAAATLMALVDFLRVDFEASEDQLDKVVGSFGRMQLIEIQAAM